MTSAFLERVIEVATSFIGTRETAPNSGPHIDAWLALLNLSPGNAWCAAALHGWFEQVAQEWNIPNPFPRTASALHVASMAPPSAYRKDPERGLVYVLDHGGGLGHTGIVTLVNGKLVTDISGNTNAAGSRDGNCVASHTWDPLSGSRGKLVGYLDFTPPDPAAVA